MYVYDAEHTPSGYQRRRRRQVDTGVGLRDGGPSRLMRSCLCIPQISTRAT